MSQNDFNIANQGFPATRADINSALQALASNSAGTAEPSTTYAYQFWYDETNELLKMRNSDNDAWITIGTFDQVADTFTPAGVTTDKIEEGNSSVEVVDTGTGYVAVVVDGVERARVDANGRLGIGTSSPSENLHISSATGDVKLKLDKQGTSTAITSIELHNGGTGQPTAIIEAGGTGTSSNGIIFKHGNNGSEAERMRITSTGQLLIGRTATSGVADGHRFDANGFTQHVRDGGEALEVVRETSDGDIVVFKKGTSTVGSIASYSSNDIVVLSPSVGYLGIGSTRYLGWGTLRFYPVTDNSYDLGGPSNRFDDVYATNGTIQTSDRNEKQDIETLSDAEQRVAIAAKGLLRKYRWKDAVAEKGDAARIHFGIIAQDLQAAFEAEGLDAGRYAMFISSTWWEAERVIPAVEAVAAQDAVYETVVIPAEYDEDGNEISPERTEQVLVSEAVEAVEAQPERTVTDTYQTQEEAPEGAVERTRMGVRYPELLAFIIAAI